MKRLRFTVRWLMVAMAVVTMAGSAVVYIARKIRNPYFDEPYAIRALRRHEAERHADKAANTLGKRAAFHRAMKAKWEFAAKHPGLSVEPDPPEPE